MTTMLGSNTQQYTWNGEERRNADRSEHFDISLEHAGQLVFRYGLALIFVWIGILKFTAYIESIWMSFINGWRGAWILPRREGDGAEQALCDSWQARS